MRKPAFQDRAFYRERLDDRGLPTPWTLDDLEEFAALRLDPFGGRCREGVTPPVSLQVEATGEPPVWVGFEGRELDAWASGLARTWARWGMKPGETIAFFEYGSSPLVLLASASYVAYLRRGAADRLGVAAICNDGVAAMAGRMVSIVERIRPSAIVVRRDLLGPFTEALTGAGVTLAGVVRWAAMSEVEGLPSRREAERARRAWGVPVHRILRSDAAQLLAGDCPECGLVHLDSRSYRAEALAGGIAVTARFARTCPTVRYALGHGELRRGGCEREPDAWRLALD